MTTVVAPDLSELIFEEVKLKGFRVHELCGVSGRTHSPGRRDFYKVVLGTGEMTFYYGDQTIEVNGTALIFSNPHVPYAVTLHKLQKSYGCLFTEEFMMSTEWTERLRDAPFFRFDGMPVIPVDREQQEFITGLFKKMQSVHTGEYDQKRETLRKCVELIMYEALSVHPQKEVKHKNAAARITGLFLELLERQFPIEHKEDPLKLRTAQDFAASLGVHINYLNRTVKEVTGKPTTTHIADRIAAEAKDLLQHTDWSIADIAYALGFEYPTYFNNYFKRIMGATPNSYRKD